MMKTMVFSIASIYVPVKRRATLDAPKVQRLAESIMEEGQKAPILVCKDPVSASCSSRDCTGSRPAATLHFIVRLQIKRSDTSPLHLGPVSS